MAITIGAALYTNSGHNSPTPNAVVCIFVFISLFLLKGSVTVSDQAFVSKTLRGNMTGKETRNIAETKHKND